MRRWSCRVAASRRLRSAVLAAVARWRRSPIWARSRATMSSDSAAGSALSALALRSEEHTSELQSLMRISYAVFCLKKKKTRQTKTHHYNDQNPQHKVTIHPVVTQTQ